MANSDGSPWGVVILAAGHGKRMRSVLPKVLVEVAGAPMIVHILRQIRAVTTAAPVAIVVGHGREQVESVVRARKECEGMNLSFVVQEEQLGTGHALQCVMQSAWGQGLLKQKRSLVVLPGDLPLISADLVRGMVEPMGSGVGMRLLTTRLEDPSGYGRVVRRGTRGGVIKIVEEKDASPRQKKLQEVGASIYCFKPDLLNAGLRQLDSKNSQKEYYLTDIVAFCSRKKKGIDVLEWGHSEELRGVNNPWELSQARGIFNRRLLKEMALQGVQFLDPCSTWVDAGVKVGEGSVVEPGVILRGNTHIGTESRIGAYSVLQDAKIGSQVHLKAGCVIEESSVASHAVVGPYAHLRPGSQVCEEAKIGNFVELKKTKVGKKTSVAHLSYLGDAEVGERVNIGCGFVTCNFDGRVIGGQRKHKTVIEDDVFVGSDCQVVAPIKLGHGSYVASGSTVTEDVEADALVIARSRQVQKPGYARKLRQKE